MKDSDPLEDPRPQIDGSDPLEDPRLQIDGIDQALIDLIAQRMNAVRSIAEIKDADPHQPLRDESRERQVHQTWRRRGAAAGLSSYFLGRILREIVHYSRRDQERRLRGLDPAAGVGDKVVGFQGIVGAHSQLAVAKLYTSRCGVTPRSRGYAGFEEVVEALERGEIDAGLLPIENTTAGSINEVYTLLGKRRLHIVDEEYWEVRHVLAAKHAIPVDELRVIRSHPVALRQCGHFLSRLREVEVEHAFDTAGAAREIASGDSLTTAAICSEEAAREYGLEVLARDLADQPDNITRFVLVRLQAESPDPRLRCRTSMVLTTDHRQGSLARCLDIFSERRINLCKLESRPQPETPWQYLFYLDIEGRLAHPQVAAAIEEVRSHCNSLRILGCYPMRNLVEALPTEETEPAAEAPAGGKVVAEPAAAARPHPRRIAVGTALFGPDQFTVIAGPCAVESRSQILQGAEMVRAAGATLLRGGAFKPRSSPYSFQGLGFEGLELLHQAGRAYELPIVTEVLRPEDVAAVAAKADMLQVGARNMQNFALLQELGRIDRPVLLKRGMSATLDEMLLAAEYIMAGGNHEIILCERGIRTFEPATRATLDLSAVPVLKERSPLPVIVDPSHAAGRRELVIPLALAAAAAGADGLIVECHPDPAAARCDKEQALTGEDLQRLMRALVPILEGAGKRPGQRGVA